MTMSEHGGTEVALQVEDLHKSFGTLEVLKGISLTAHERDVISILGSSGSGKSTFLRCINLLEVPSAGRVYVRGELIKMTTNHRGETAPADNSQVDRIRARLGMVFQQFNLWSHLTVIENVIEAPVHVLKQSTAAPRSLAPIGRSALLDKVGLGDGARGTQLDGYYPDE